MKRSILQTLVVTMTALVVLLAVANVSLWREGFSLRREVVALRATLDEKGRTPKLPAADNERPYAYNRAGCRIGVLAGCDSETVSRKVFNRAEIVPFEDFKDAVRHLLNEKIDGLVYDEHVLRLAQWHYPDRFRILSEPLDTDPSVIAVSERRPELRDEINRFIADYRKSGLYDEMFLRWCHDPERRPEDVPTVDKLLCQEPDAKPLRVGIDPVQEPNAFVDGKGRVVGFDVEFAYRFGRSAKYRIAFTMDAEDELMRQLADGELDVVIANLGKDDRKGVLWTAGYLDSDIMMMVKERE